MTINKVNESRRDGVFNPVFRPYGTFCFVSGNFNQPLVPLGPEVPIIILKHRHVLSLLDKPGTSEIVWKRTTLELSFSILPFEQEISFSFFTFPYFEVSRFPRETHATSSQTKIGVTSSIQEGTRIDKWKEIRRLSIICQQDLAGFLLHVSYENLSKWPRPRSQLCVGPPTKGAGAQNLSL